MKENKMTDKFEIYFKDLTPVDGRDKVSQKWSFKNEPPG